MKWLISLVVVCVLVGAGYYFLGSSGGSARMEVAKDKLLARVDSALGKLDVERKQIENGMAGLKTGIDGIRTAKIKAKVKQDQIQQSVDSAQEKVAAIDATLGKLRTYLSASQPAEISGKTYSQADLKDMADRVLKARKEQTSQIDSLKQSQASLQRVASSMDRKQTEYEAKLAALKNQLTEIDSKTIALKAMQDASKAMDKADDTFASNVAKLEDQVANLHAEVETQLRSEDAKWNEASMSKEIDSVDAFVKATQEPSDPLAEINRVLGGAKP